MAWTSLLESRSGIRHVFSLKMDCVALLCWKSTPRIKFKTVSWGRVCLAPRLHSPIYYALWHQTQVFTLSDRYFPVWEIPNPHIIIIMNFLCPLCELPVYTKPNLSILSCYFIAYHMQIFHFLSKYIKTVLKHQLFQLLSLFQDHLFSFIY